MHSPELFRTILDSLEIGMCLVDLDQRIRFWNAGAERITGYQAHDVVGHHCRENILATCNSENCGLCGAACPLAGAMHEGKTREAYVYFHHKKGHPVPVHVWTVAIRDTHGSIIAVAESFTERSSARARDRRQSNLAAHGCLDETTGVPTQGFTQFRLRENLAGLAEYHLPFGVVCIHVQQLDSRKASHGKQAVDAALQLVATTLQDLVRPTDLLGRWSEDQFLLIAVNCPAMGLDRVADHIIRATRHAELDWWGDRVPIICRFGHVAAQEGDTVDSLVERAQTQLKNSSAATAAAGQSGG